MNEDSVPLGELTPGTIARSKDINPSGDIDGG
jgi:hypothetical protein